MKALLKRHPKTTIIWAHTGVGRIVHPAQHQGTGGAGARSRSEAGRDRRGILADPAFKHLYFDISWDEVAKYVVATPQTRQGGRRR